MKTRKEIEELKKKLSKEQYEICFLKGTEAPFSGKHLTNKKKGTYVCAVCEMPLFSSETKFESDTGWPSFDQVISAKNIELKEDSTLGMQRTEVMCKNCGSHLGHLFNDGPTKSGLRYCINSLALDFKITRQISSH